MSFIDIGKRDGARQHDSSFVAHGVLRCVLTSNCVFVIGIIG